MIDGVMKGRCVEADFEADTLTFKMNSGYYAKAGFFYLVPNTIFEEMAMKLGLSVYPVAPGPKPVPRSPGDKEFG